MLFQATVVDSVCTSE